MMTPFIVLTVLTVGVALFTLMLGFLFCRAEMEHELAKLTPVERLYYEIEQVLNKEYEKCVMDDLKFTADVTVVINTAEENEDLPTTTDFDDDFPWNR